METNSLREAVWRTRKWPKQITDLGEGEKRKWEAKFL